MINFFRRVKYLFGGGKTVIMQSLNQELADLACPLVATVWHGVPIIVKIRNLSGASIASLGNLTMIETFEDKMRQNEKPTVEELNTYAERHHKMVKLALVLPSYDDIMAAAKTGMDDKYFEDELKNIKTQWAALPYGKEKAELKKSYDALEISYRFLLPAEFTAPIVAYVTGSATSDIKKITGDMLFHAAVLASRGGDNPADHMSGDFIRFEGDRLLLDDINNRAWVEYDKRTSEKEKK